MKILGLLENQWFDNPQRVRLMLADQARRGHDHLMRYRERLVTFALFRGCHTGRRLEALFGRDLAHSFVWEESTPEVGGSPGEKFTPDSRHVLQVLDYHKPDLVIAFGRGAQVAIQGLLPATQVLKAPHPCARGDHDRKALALVALQVKDLLNRTAKT